MATREEIKIKESVSYLSKKDYKVLKPNELRCICCGKSRSVWESKNWFMSWSPLHLGNTALYKYYKKGEKEPMYRQQSFVPTCRRCVEDVYLKEADLKDLVEVLRIIDKPYIKDVWDTEYEKNKHRYKPSTLLGNYISNINLNNKDLTFKDSDEIVYGDEIITEEESDKLKKKELKQAVFKWGAGFTPDEYAFLEREWHKLVTSYECDSYSQETLFEEVALTKLEIKKKRAGGNEVDKQLKTLQDLLGSANVKPVQETGANENEKVSFGTLIKKWENEDPIPRGLDDEMKEYIDTFMSGHLAKMQGLKNDLTEKYDKAISEYTIDFEELLEEDEGDM